MPVQSKTLDLWREEAASTPLIPSQEFFGATFSFVENSRQLFFDWDGYNDNSVQVSFGGWDTGVKWTFRFSDHKPKGPIAGTYSMALAFREACERWIEAKEDAR